MASTDGIVIRCLNGKKHFDVYVLAQDDCNITQDVFICTCKSMYEARHLRSSLQIAVTSLRSVQSRPKQLRAELFKRVGSLKLKKMEVFDDEEEEEEGDAKGAVDGLSNGGDTTMRSKKRKSSNPRPSAPTDAPIPEPYTTSPRNKLVRLQQSVPHSQQGPHQVRPHNSAPHNAAAELQHAEQAHQEHLRMQQQQHMYDEQLQQERMRQEQIRAARMRQEQRVAKHVQEHFTEQKQQYHGNHNHVVDHRHHQPPSHVAHAPQHQHAQLAHAPQHHLVVPPQPEVEFCAMSLLVFSGGDWCVSARLCDRNGVTLIERWLMDIQRDGKKAIDCFHAAVNLYIAEWAPTQDVLDSLHYALLNDSDDPGTPPATDVDVRHVRQHAIENKFVTDTALTLTLVLSNPGRCWVVGAVLEAWGKGALQLTLYGVDSEYATLRLMVKLAAALRAMHGSFPNDEARLRMLHRMVAEGVFEG